MTRSDFCLKRCSSQFEIPWTVHLHHRQSQNNARCLVAAHSIGRIGNFTRPSHGAYLMAPNPNDPAPLRNSILKGRIMRAAQQPRPPPQTLGKKGRKEGIGGRERVTRWWCTSRAFGQYAHIVHKRHPRRHPRNLLERAVAKAGRNWRARLEHTHRHTPFAHRPQLTGGH